MPTIKKSYTDNGQSKNKDNLWFDDHDSDMSFDVVKKLVLDMKVFLTGVLFDDADPVKRPFKKLQDVLESVGDEIDITKGIHQRLEDPHITFSITGDAFNPLYEFHLQLSAEDVNRVYVDNGVVNRFFWKPVKLSVFVKKGEKGEKEYASHPAGVVARKTGRLRGYSITEGQLECHVEGMNNFIAMQLEQERIKQEQLEKERIEKERREQEMLTNKDNFPGLGSGNKKPLGSPAPVTNKTVVPKGKNKWSKLV